MPKIDFKKEFKNLYSPSAREPQMVDVPPMYFLMVDGEGNPNGSERFQEAVEALYSISYTLKFMVKESGTDYVVAPLEGLWWCADTGDFSMARKDDWIWTLMIMQPEAVTTEMFEAAKEKVLKKKGLRAAADIRFERFHEGLSAQIMHIGPYSEEPPTIEKLHNFIKEKSCSLRGKHHEIYLSDPRRSAPEKMKTIIRQPVE